MDYNLTNRVILSTDREHKNLYPWSIKEFDGNGAKIGGDQIPWPWSVSFEVVELVPACQLSFKSASYGLTFEEAKQGDEPVADVSPYIFGKVRPQSAAREAGRYSMFGTDRDITEFQLFIRRAADGKDRCSLWGSISYSSEWDFQDVTEPDAVQIYIYLQSQKFDELMSFVKFPRPTSATVRLGGVSGFYSEWSPSIRTNQIKILANTKDQALENPEQLEFSPPTLGAVEEFDLQMQQKYPLQRNG